MNEKNIDKAPQNPIIEGNPKEFKNKVDNSWAITTENYMEDLNADQKFLLYHISWDL